MTLAWGKHTLSISRYLHVQAHKEQLCRKKQIPPGVIKHATRSAGHSDPPHRRHNMETKRSVMWEDTALLYEAPTEKESESSHKS